MQTIRSAIMDLQVSRSDLPVRSLRAQARHGNPVSPGSYCQRRS